MASAWQQASEVQAANELLRRAQAALVASESIHSQRLGALTPATYLLVSGPLQPRVTYEAAASGKELTARGMSRGARCPLLRPRPVPTAAAPRGRAARRFGVAGQGASENVVTRLNTRAIRPAPRSWPSPNAMVTMESVLGASPCNVDWQKQVQAMLERWSPQKLIGRSGRC